MSLGMSLRIFFGGVSFGDVFGVYQAMSLERFFAVVLGNVFGRCL